MLKNLFKKALASVAAVTMAVTIMGGVGSNVAYAASGNTADITIHPGNNEATGTVGDVTYTYYKIFDATTTTDNVTTGTNAGVLTTTGNASYTIDTSDAAGQAWFNVLFESDGTGKKNASGTVVQTWVTATQINSSTVWTVSAASGFTSETQAAAFADYLLANKPNSVTGTALTKQDDGSYKASNVPVGYYMVTSSLGTNLIAATTNVDIYEKNSYPTTTKTVDDAQHNIGDYVEFTINVKLPASVDYTKPVTVHDTMDSALSLVADKYNASTAKNGWSATVIADNAAEGTQPTDFTSNVTLVQSDSFSSHDDTNHSTAEGKTRFDFTLDISSLAPTEGTDPVAKTVTITYKAELTSDASADQKYYNKEYVEYSNYRTTEQSVDVTTFDFVLKKTFSGVSGSTDEYTATFKLTDADGNVIKFKSDSSRGTTYTYNYVKVDSNDEGTETFTVKGDDKGVNLIGLKDGTYTLTETDTQAGFNKLTKTITLTIGEDGNLGTVKFGDTEVSNSGDVSKADNVITVVNTAGSLLPSTGGIGTTIFYIVGGVLIAGAAVLLIFRRRRRA